MPTDVARPKVTPTQVLADMARLTASQLQTVIECAAQLRLQKRKLVLPARESDLLRVINRGLSAAKTARLEQLQQKLREETIARREQQQMLQLTDELERLGVERLKALLELAAIRKTSVPKLMLEMGLAETNYA
jgi:hypothetical protein